mmetsp:Transcript_70107/g.164960  ORF Transcript_70107/g.164960 Transcript_70107/m.164960 type:complete len:336 (+) Transcript_70107:63-1070(+)
MLGLDTNATTSETELVFCPLDDLVIGGVGGDSGVLIVPLSLPLGEGHLALRHLPVRSEVIVVVDDGGAIAAADEAAEVARGQHHLVVVELVLVTLGLDRGHRRLPHVAVDVAVVVVVVPAKVVLESAVAVDEEVVVRFVVAGAVVVVDIFLGTVVVDEEVVVDLTPRHEHGRGPVSLGGEERLPIPRVEGTMVAALTAGREDQVVTDFVAAAEAVVGVDAGARSVEEYVTHNDRCRRLRLDKEGALFLVEANLSGRAARDGGVLGVFAVGSVDASFGVVSELDAGATRVSGRLVGVAPRRNGVTPDVREVRLGDGGVAVISRHHDAVSVETIEGA